MVDVGKENKEQILALTIDDAILRSVLNSHLVLDSCLLTFVCVENRLQGKVFRVLLA